jgi:hypothetical protein
MICAKHSGFIECTNRSAYAFRFGLRVGKPWATLSQLLTKNSVLSLQIVDYVVLVAIHPDG